MTNQEGIAVVYSRADESTDNRAKDMRGDGASDCSKPPKVTIAVPGKEYQACILLITNRAINQSANKSQWKDYAVKKSQLIYPEFTVLTLNSALLSAFFSI